MAFQDTTFRSNTKTLSLQELHLNQETRNSINQLIEEFTYIEVLTNYGIPVDNKILLHGMTGCGKTATAHAIGKALNKPVYTLNLGGFVSSKLGETGKIVSEIFRKVSSRDAILFIDEFDFIGKMRDYNNQDSGEMKRLVNTLIQQIDNLSDQSILIGATNHVEAIDSALLRRFQVRLKYQLPTNSELDRYYDSLLERFPKDVANINKTYGISYAEAKDTTYQQVKYNIIKIEKQKKHYLFSYGSLQLERLQKDLYNRILKSEKDTLTGYQVEEIQIKDKTVVIKSGTASHPVAIKTDNPADTIEGSVFEITTLELLKSDKYKIEDYQRVSARLQSGREAWMYVKKN